MNEFSINELYRQAFGVERGEPFNEKELRMDKNAGKLPQHSAYDYPAQAQTESEFLRIRNLLGVRLRNGASVFMPLKIGNFTFPNEPTMDVSSRKHIVETVLVNAHGTVKEMISTGDYEFTIRGIAIDAFSKIFYPEEMVRDLNALYKQRESLPIVCALTELLGVRRVVIKDFKLPSMVGVQHAQAYELAVVSDHEFILELK
jgi:hypothetical protein